VDLLHSDLWQVLGENRSGSASKVTGYGLGGRDSIPDRVVRSYFSSSLQ